jgi:predicted nucleic acid-binding protein
MFEAMRIYLDTCTIQRPTDDMKDARVRLEAQAVAELVSLIQAGRIELVSSVVLQIEHNRNRNPLRRGASEQILALATEVVTVGESVERRMQAYGAVGLNGPDAAHLACAVEVEVDYFCTCDDKLLRRAKKLDTGLTRTVSPLELIEEVQR